MSPVTQEAMVTKFYRISLWIFIPGIILRKLSSVLGKNADLQVSKNDGSIKTISNFGWCCKGTCPMKILLLTLLLITPCLGIAGESAGQITHVMVHTGNVVMFSAGVHSNKPSCSTVGDHWALSLNDETGRAMYSMLLLAAATGKEVSVTGKNNCDAWGDRESVLYMHINE